MHLPSVVTRSNQSNYKLEKLQTNEQWNKNPLTKAKSLFVSCTYLSLAVKIIKTNSDYSFSIFSKILSRKSIAFPTKHKHPTLIYPSKSGKKNTHSDTFPNSLDLIIVCPTLTWKIHIAIKSSPLLTFNRTGAITASGFLVIFKFDRFLLTRSCHTCCTVFSFCRYVHVHSLFIFLLFK